MEHIGARKNPSSPQAPAAIIEQLKSIPSALISDNMRRLAGTSNLRPMYQGEQLVGTAVTVRVRPGDNLAIHRAFDYCRPGDVMVIDGGGDTTQALMGEIMTTYARTIGIAGLVIDGAIRDVAGIREMGYPVFARGATHKGPYKCGPGEINVPVSIDGLVINPGDIIVADEDGIVAFAQSEASYLIEKALQQIQREQDTMTAIREGRYDRSWIDALEANSAG
ncbi:RraA family protein [Herbaspirillum huttiense]|uniref:Putative 4-hydroxy-4-methyl-2-oxoglutarate aldolase n=1 Tax=Herbaspirillum huttiense subsp. lycopersici TaxID=3074428 RepID=A0ABU2EQ44_9BURK|nr:MULTISPECIES: RraA family protein [Herbaspirillum]MAF04359.1 methyltransferase [Herbaspirillum sp.]MBO15422.1 methyltransferase [Herbaspirillum sp.]MBP1315140.1 RraA family protein [Herbaspirillum sp. 1130]MDR6743167.1 RraA family protein [Herbaspirillum sp. 1173]MDR9850289.1 RraA family protein [Herbaspirillum huttiense SE1]|tara:strand:- start:8071 stop:8736 length:666 start_codon:yes stop_codon:yes gene_type:complete